MKNSSLFAITLIAATFLGCGLISGCATCLSDRHQVVHVDTNPVLDANCHLKNGHGEYVLNKTPGDVKVHKAFSDLDVLCRKDKHLDSHQVVKSSAEGSTFGNIILGGGVGAIVDGYNGSGYRYPNSIHVQMEPKKISNIK